MEWDLENMRKYGKVWGSYAISEPWLTVGDPKLIKAIMVRDHHSHFPGHSIEIGQKNFRTLDISTGEEWRDLRKGLSPTFTSGKIKGMLDLLEDSVDNLIDHLDEVTEKNPVVDVKYIFQAMALDIIAKCAFGIESNSFKNPDNKIFQHGRKIFEDFRVTNMTTSLFIQFFFTCDFLAKYLDVTSPSFRDLWNLTRSVQAERAKQGATTGDFIDRLNELNEKWKKGEFPALSSEQITGQGIIFIAAGFETTSNTLSTLCYNLAKHPDVLDTLITEVDEVFDQFDGVVNHETISEMPFLEACIKENLRLNGPVARNDRKCVKDWDGGEEFGGLKIPAGMKIRFPLNAIHHNPEFWPEPELYKPERFLKENLHNIKPFSFLPFGGGPRECIGERFAMSEMKVAMVKLLHNYKICWDDSTNLQLHKGDLFLFTFPSIKLRFIRRNASQ